MQRLFQSVAKAISRQLVDFCNEKPKAVRAHEDGACVPCRASVSALETALHIERSRILDLPSFPLKAVN